MPADHPLPTRTLLRACRMLTLGLCAWLAACGGGGGGSAGDGGGPAVTLGSDVYPLNTGDTRTWRITATGVPAGATRTERVGERSSVGGRSVLAVRDSDGAVDYVDGSGAAVTLVPGSGSDALSLAAGPVDLLRYGQAQGEMVVLYDRTVTVDLDADGRADSIDLRIESTFIGRETVVTPAGTFTDAARVRTVVRSTVRLAGVPGTSNSVFTSDDWFAPGVGPVKSSSTTVTGGQPPLAETEELIAYGVGTRRNESVAPTLASVMPAADGLASPSVRPVLAFSEALDPLSLDSPTGLAFVDAAGTAVRADRSLSADGRQITLTPQTALADGRYELRLGTAITDLAGNPLGATVRAFTVDTSGPRVVASQPAAGSLEAPLTGAIRLTYNEPIVAVAGTAVTMRLSLFPSPESVFLPAVVNGNELVATLTTPLLRNREYVVSNGSPLTDAAGNPLAGAAASVRFRTDPGPLDRPTATWEGRAISAVARGDIDGDGRADLVLVGQVIGTPDHVVGVRLQQADGRFASPVTLHKLDPSFSCDPTGLVVADLDGNGRADIALARCFTPLTVLLQQPDGRFLAETPAVEISAPVLRALDLDGDGRLALVTAAATEFRVLRRDARGTWTPVLTVPGSTDSISDWRLADLDGDGRLDLVFVRSAPGNTSFELAWALRRGSGFTAAGSLPLAALTTDRPALAVGDVTGDGHADVLLTAIRDGNSELLVLPGNGGGGFGAAVRYASYFNAATVSVADVDGDGRADVLVTHSTTYQLGVYLQATDGALQAERRFDIGYAYYAGDPVSVLDLNADGRLDVVVASDLLAGRAWGGAWPLTADPGSRPQAVAGTARAQKSRITGLRLCTACALALRR